MNYERINRIGKTTVVLKQPLGKEVHHQDTYHYISAIGALIVRDVCDGNVASYPAGEWASAATV